MALIIPKKYTRKLLPETTEVAIKNIKDTFQQKLARALNLRRVTAPLFVLTGTGLNDDLNGVERAVSFTIKAMDDRSAEVVHSLAKWKRAKLGAYDIAPGYGLYTDMNAIRTFEELDNLTHRGQIGSVLVRDDDAEIVLNGHHKLDNIQRIRAQIVRNVCVHRDTIFVDLELVCQKRSHFFKNHNAPPNLCCYRFSSIHG